MRREWTIFVASALALPWLASTQAFAYGDYDSGSSYDSGYGSGGSSYGSSGFSPRGDRRAGGQQDTYSLSIAGGIAAPSLTGFFGENPAGMIYNQHGTATGYIASDRDDSGLLSTGLGFGAGNGWASAMVGIQSFNNASDDRGSITKFNFGAATYISPIDTAVGLSGSYRFQTGSRAVDPSTEPTWTADLGLLFNPYGTFQVAATAYELSKGMTAMGAGLAAHINPFSTFALDASVDRHGRGLTVKPGLGVRAGPLNLTYAYGMQVDKSAPAGITAGNTLGLGYEFSRRFRVIGYYNHYATYYLGGTIDLF